MGHLVMHLLLLDTDTSITCKGGRGKGQEGAKKKRVRKETSKEKKEEMVGYKDRKQKKIEKVSSEI